jgi:hypothetical protein
MSVQTQTFRGKANLTPPSNPKVYNEISPVAAGTEFSVVLDSGTKKFLIRSRTGATIRLSFVATETDTNYITIPKGANFSEDSVDFNSSTLYLQVDASAVTIEILQWT